jgi:hypothetical protein
MRHSVISFRTSENLRKALQKISVMDRRTLSSVIENILLDYISRREPKAVGKEKRRHPRMKISAPALVSGPDGSVHAGVVNDISFGGINLSVPHTFPRDMRSNSMISVVFALRHSEKPLTMQCVPRYIRADGKIHIGASLADADFYSHRVLEEFMAETTLQRLVTSGDGRVTIGKEAQGLTLV